MEKYKIASYDVDENKKIIGTSEIETDIPNVLVVKIQEAINNLGGELIPTPVMIDVNDMSIVFGILEKNESDGWAYKKYKVIIKTEKYV